jgi:transposase
VLRKRICLLAHKGLTNRRIAQHLKASWPTVILWRNHFLKDRVAGLEHEPSRKTSSQRTKDDQIKAIVEATPHMPHIDWQPRCQDEGRNSTIAGKYWIPRRRCFRIREKQGMRAKKEPKHSGAREKSGGEPKKPCQSVEQAENHKKANAGRGLETIWEINQYE